MMPLGLLTEGEKGEVMEIISKAHHGDQFGFRGDEKGRQPEDCRLEDMGLRTGKTVEILGDIVAPIKAEILEPVIIKGYPGEKDFADLDQLAEKIAAKLHDRIKIRPTIQFVGPGSLPKETRKTPLFEKKYDE